MIKQKYVYEAKVLSVHDGDTITVEVDLGFELKFTDEELSELIDVNSGIDASVNGVKLKSEDFLEQVYIMFS